MAPTARRAAMAKTPISPRNRGERGAALLEAAVALALVAMIAAAGVSAFGMSGRRSAEAAERLENLRLAENAIEIASAPAMLRRALDKGEAAAEGDGWRVSIIPYDGDDGTSPLALALIRAEAGRVTLETLRSLPR